MQKTNHSERCLRNVRNNRNNPEQAKGQPRKHTQIKSSIGTYRLPAVKEKKDRYDYLLKIKDLYPFYKKIFGDLKIKPSQNEKEIYYQLTGKFEDYLTDEETGYPGEFSIESDGDEPYLCISKTYPCSEYTVFPINWLLCLTNETIPLFANLPNRFDNLYKLSLNFLTVFYRFSGVQMWRDNMLEMVEDSLKTENEIEDEHPIEDGSEPIDPIELKKDIARYKDINHIADELCREIKLEDFEEELNAYVPRYPLETEMIKLFEDGLKYIKEHSDLNSYVAPSFGGGEVYPTAYFQMVLRTEDLVCFQFYKLIRDIEDDCGSGCFAQNFKISLDDPVVELKKFTVVDELTDFIHKFNNFIYEEFGKLYAKA